MIMTAVDAGIVTTMATITAQMVLNMSRESYDGQSLGGDNAAKRHAGVQSAPSQNDPALVFQTIVQRRKTCPIA
jgi:hypothetical protein